MAFFRNYSNDTVSHNVLDENEERQNAATLQGSPLNDDMDGTYSERGFDMNMDVQYQSDAEPGCSIRQQNQTTIGNVAAPVDSHYQHSGRRMGVSGKWGSTFWKDCQPMGQREGSDSAKDSQSGYLKEADHSEDNLSNERSEKIDSENENEEDKAMNKRQSAQADVPADEMLSDEYYEQDEDNQSDHVHYKRYSNAINSRTLPKTGSAIHSKSRASRAIQKNINYDDGNHGHNGDADLDYEEEEDGKLL